MEKNFFRISLLGGLLGSIFILTFSNPIFAFNKCVNGSVCENISGNWNVNYNSIAYGYNVNFLLGYGSIGISIATPAGAQGSCPRPSYGTICILAPSSCWATGKVFQINGKNRAKAVILCPKTLKDVRISISPNDPEGAHCDEIKTLQGPTYRCIAGTGE